MQDPSRVRLAGPLALYVAGFRVQLELQGYSTKVVCEHLRLAMQVSRALAAEGLGPEALTKERVEAFAAARRRAGRAAHRSTRSLRPLLEFLATVGACPPPESATVVDGLLESYRLYLFGERSLAASTVRGYMDTARRFLLTRCGGDPSAVGGLSAGDVSGFVLSEAARGLSPRTVNETVVGVRSVLRFFYLRGLIHAPLAQATPWLAKSRAGSLPGPWAKALLARVLDSCDRTTLVGVRDFAMITLLSRLALRAGEVAALELGDIDWRRGELVIHGKGGSADPLPLGVDVGEALSDYLGRRGPAAGCRQVFLHVKAPRDGVGATDVRAAVRRACWRAGFDDLTLKQRALARTAPPGTHPGRYRPTDKLLAFLEGL